MKKFSNYLMRHQYLFYIYWATMIPLLVYVFEVFLFSEINFSWKDMIEYIIHSAWINYPTAFFIYHFYCKKRL